VTAHTLRGDPGQWPLLPPIGRPIPKASIHILDGEMRPTLNGNAGEIYIGGGTLARGYWKREDLTAERFIPDPFSKEPNARLYRRETWAAGSIPGPSSSFAGLINRSKFAGFA